MTDLAQEVVDALAQEIGILSAKIVVAEILAKHAGANLAMATEQNEALKSRILAYEEDLKTLRLQVAPKNHPVHKAKVK